MDIIIDMIISPANLLNVLKENNLINEFLSDISNTKKLNLLHLIGYDDARAIKDKPSRIETYLRTKIKFLRNSIIKDDAIAELSIIFWLESFLKNESEQSGISKLKLRYSFADREAQIEDNITEEKKTYLIKDNEIKEKEDFLLTDSINFLYPLIKRLIDENNIWKAYLIASLILFSDKNNLGDLDSFEKNYLDNFRKLNVSYLTSKLEEFINDFFILAALENEVNKLKDEFSTLGEQLVNAGQNMADNGVIPSKDILNRLNLICSDFERFKKLIQQAANFYNIGEKKDRELK